MTEQAFQDAVVELAKLQGWLVHHGRRVKTPTGYRQPIQGDRGFPDLVLCRAGVVLLVELKADRGRLSVHQRAWLEEAQGQIRVWRPSDWTEISQTLKRYRHRDGPHQRSPA